MTNSGEKFYKVIKDSKPAEFELASFSHQQI